MAAMNLRSVARSACWLALIAPIGVFVAACSKPPEEDRDRSGHGAEPAGEVPVLYPLPEFSFTDQDGKTFGLKDLRSKVWVADFIFTRCPSTCPMQTAEKAKMQDGMAEDVRFVTFTVDPEHDTPEMLAAYAKRHGADPARWKFLTGARGDLWNFRAPDLEWW